MYSNAFISLLNKMQTIGAASEQLKEANYAFLLIELPDYFNDPYAIQEAAHRITEKAGSLNLAQLDRQELELLVLGFFSNYDIVKGASNLVNLKPIIEKEYYSTIVENFETIEQRLKSEFYLILTSVVEALNRSFVDNTQIGLSNLDLSNIRAVTRLYEETMSSDISNRDYSFYSGLKQINSIMRGV